MKTFRCVCGSLIFFHNVVCTNCGREIAFLPDVLRLSSLEPAGDDLFKANAGASQDQLYRKCQNYAKESVCNWMIAVAPEGPKAEPFCASCRLNQTIPDLSLPQNHALWALMEMSKRRLLYSLLNLRLPIENKVDDPHLGLAFAFLEDQKKPDGSISKVLTGHEDGLITLNIAEADDAVRETIRVAMGEPLRTLLGHFRHEIGHYYWDRLVRGTPFIDRFRELFGNEELDYAEALKTYYANGAPGDWQDHYISAYATAHPWEDWAETWAHFMHIQDTLETAIDFGLVGKAIRLDPCNVAGEASEALEQNRDGTRVGGQSVKSGQKTVEEIINAWSDLTIALNSINRSMGLHDAYPFILSPAVVKKLGFIFEVISAGAPPITAPEATAVARTA
jgi:hypothetical protein